ncbi:angiopoietin-related protein 5-like isoform X1 [Myxocyprinus asiaticus]|uniref:angiopoietin-related protein 5-like isoform X1 n=1 Tax=Myxocyprinus asiaticus TaxID=70543 RepID=UPI00222282BF|nr:angiopoietin-related protein 5-like isoform X1 [Myxocyprinus asiaticus]
MIWITLFLFHTFPHLLASSNTTMNASSTNLNEPDKLTEAFEDGSHHGQKEHYNRDAGKDKCTMPCEMTAKLMRDEKHSLCINLQHTMVSYTRNTRKLIRDLIDEQQKALEFLSSQLMELMARVNTLSLDVQRSNSDIFSLKPMLSHGRDCSDIKETLGEVSPKIPSGIYLIQPENTDVSFEVFCEMDYMEVGWTVIQRKTDGLTDFKRVWSEYLDGFGHLPGDHWLGLRKVFNIVSQKNTRFQLHVSLVSHDDSTAYASYDNFWIEDETKFFAIHLGRYAGSAGDAFRGYYQEQNQDTAPFSTSDVDNDGCIPFCTFDNKAVESCSVHQNNTGWWFNQCGKANLNGSPLDQDRSTQSHIRWDTWTKNGIPVRIKSVSMKIRRVDLPN